MDIAKSTIKRLERRLLLTRGIKSFNETVRSELLGADFFKYVTDGIGQSRKLNVALEEVISQGSVTQNPGVVINTTRCKGYTCSDSEIYNYWILHKSKSGDYRRGYIVFVNDVPLGHIKCVGERTFMAWQTIPDGKGYTLIHSGLYQVSSELYKIMTDIKKPDDEKWGRIDVDKLVINPVRFIGVWDSGLDMLMQEDVMVGDCFRTAIKKEKEMIENNTMRYSTQIKA